MWRVFFLLGYALLAFQDTKANDGISLVRIHSFLPHHWDITHTAPSSTQPAKYLFYAKAELWRHIITSPARYLVLAFTYEFVDERRNHRITGEDIDNYLDINKEAVSIPLPRSFYVKATDHIFGCWSWKFPGDSDNKAFCDDIYMESNFTKTQLDVHYPVAVKFKEAYYRDQINKYKLKVVVSAKFSNMECSDTYWINPMEVNANVSSDTNNCERTLNLDAFTPNNTSWNSAVKNNVFFFGSVKEDFYPSDLERTRIDNYNFPEKGSQKLIIPIYKGRNTNQDLEILAYEPGFLPARAKLDVEAAKGLSITTHYHPDNKSVSVRASVPECHRDVRPTTIALSYSAAIHLVNPPETIIILASQISTTISIPVEDIDRCKQILSISARSSRFINTASMNLNLPTYRKIQLNASYHGSEEGSGERISMEVKLPAFCPGDTNPISVDLSYSPASILPYLIEAPSSVNFQKGETNKKVDLYLKHKRCGAPTTLGIIASAPGFEDSNLSTVGLPEILGGDLLFNLQQEIKPKAPEEDENMLGQAQKPRAFKIYGGQGISIPIKADFMLCYRGSLSQTSLPILYQGEGVGLLEDQPKSAEILHKEAKFMLSIRPNYENHDQSISISTGDSALSSFSKHPLHLQVLKKGKAPLTLGVNGSISATAYSVEGTVPIKISIPADAVNELNASTITLTYGKNASMYVHTVPFVLLEAGQSEVQFDLNIKKFNQVPQQLTVIASNDEGNFRPSDQVTIELSKLPLLLSAVTKNEFYQSVEVKGGETPIRVKGGQLLTFKVKVLKLSDRPLNKPIVVTLAYGSDGLKEVIEPRTSVIIDPKEDNYEIEVDLNLKNIKTKSAQTLEISASADHFVSAIPLKFTLLPNVTVLRGKNGSLTLPPLPQLYLDENRHVQYQPELNTFMSQTPIDGFWIDCTLQTTRSNQLVSLAPHKVYDKLNSDEEVAKGDIISLWIPLKDNPHHYWGTTTYRIGDKQEIYYGGSLTFENRIRTGFSLSTAKIDESGNLNRTNLQGTYQHNVGGSMGVEAGVEGKSGLIIAEAKALLKSSVSTNYGYLNTQLTGLETTSNTSLVLRNDQNNSRDQEFKVAVTRTGPARPYFKMVHVPFYPTIRYCFGDPSDPSDLYIGRYIHDKGFKQMYPKLVDQTIENFVRYLFKSEATLSSYLKVYNQSLSSKNEHNKLFSTMANLMKNNPELWGTEISSYVAYILNSEIRYGDPANALWQQITVPTDCNAVPARINQYFFRRNTDGVVSNFSYDLPPSATESQLKLTNTSTGQSYHIRVERSRDQTREPARESIDMGFESFPYGFYTARVDYKCGAATAWVSHVDSLNFDYRPDENCKVDQASIRAIPQPTGGVRLEWDAPALSTKYYIEYAAYNKTFEESRKELASWGGGKPSFDQERTGNFYDYVGQDSKVKFRITAVCNNSVFGSQTVFQYVKPCAKPLAPIVYKVNNPGDPQSKGALDYRLNGDGNLFVFYDLQIKRVDASWNDRPDKEYLDLHQEFGLDEKTTPTNERIETKVNALYFDYPDKHIKRVARSRGFCRYTRDWGPYSDDSEPFDVPLEGPVIIDPEIDGQSQSSSSTTNALHNSGEEQEISTQSLRYLPRVSREISTAKPSLQLATNCVSDNITFHILGIEQPIYEVKISLYAVNAKTALLNTQSQFNVQKGEWIKVNKPITHPGIYILQVELPGRIRLLERVCKQ